MTNNKKVKENNNFNNLFKTYKFFPIGNIFIIKKTSLYRQF